MATVTENERSGIGNRGGIRGSTATRRFDVQLDTADTDASTGQLDNASNPIDPVAARYPVGSVHPVNTALVATEYEAVDKTFETTTVAHWVVEVTYEAPLVPGGTANDWTIEWMGSVETEEMIRAWLLKTVNNEVVRSGRSQQFVGGRAYREASETGGGTHTATDATGSSLSLVQLKDSQGRALIQPAQVQRYRPTGSFMLSRTITNVTVETVRQAREFLASVNQNTFLTSAPGESLCAEVSVRSQAGSDVGETQLTDGIVYAVRLVFLEDTRGWTPERIFDQWRAPDSEGNVIVSEVFPTGQSTAEFQDFEKYPAADHNALVNTFAPFNRKPVSRQRGARRP